MAVLTVVVTAVELVLLKVGDDKTEEAAKEADCECVIVCVIVGVFPTEVRASFLNDLCFLDQVWSDDSKKERKKGNLYILYSRSLASLNPFVPYLLIGIWPPSTLV